MTLKKAFLWTVAVLGFSSLPLVAACATTDSGDSVEESNLSAAIGEAVCEGIKGCCEQGRFPYDYGSCVAAYGRTKTSPHAGVIYDGRAARACMDEIRAATASCGAQTMDWNQSAACTAIYTGTRQAGEACIEDIECAHGPNERGLCQGVAATDPAGVSRHRCAVARAPQQGDSCDYNAAPEGSAPVVGDCVGKRSSGFTCQQSTKTCQPLTPVGANCVQKADCAIGATCTNRGCEALPNLGEACLPSTLECAAGLYCEGIVCREVRNAGDHCDTQEQCGENWCDETGTCSRRAISTKEICSGGN